MKIYGKVFFSDKKFCSNTFFFSGTVRFDTKDDGELATVVVLVVPVPVFLRIVAGYRTLTSSRRFWRSCPKHLLPVLTGVIAFQRPLLLS